jgi:hypothetical protein
MSEPMSKHEIEDVLLSIRRLVSDDMRPAPLIRSEQALPVASAPRTTQPSMAASASRLAPDGDDQGEADAPGKLLLTPAFRVVGPEGEALADTAGNVHDDAPGDSLESHFSSDLDDETWPGAQTAPDRLSAPRLQPVVARPEGEDEAWESPFGEGAAELPLAAHPAPKADAEDDGFVMPTFVHRGRAALRRTPLPEPEVDPDEEEDLSEPEPAAVVVPAYEELGFASRFTRQQSPYEAVRARLAEPTRAAEPVPQGDAASDLRSPAQAGDETPDSWADRAEAAVVAELEQDLAAQADAMVEDMVEELAATAAGSGAEMAAEPVADPVGRIEDNAYGDPLSGALPSGGPAEISFDEDVLRDLVRDLIREELTGSLGERITRNVRKLVRAEIARALAVREFE